MNQATPAQPGTGGLNLTPSDIFFILFRHKTKIILFILLGLVSGATLYKFWPENFQSNAKLLVRYVTEKRDVVDPDGNTRIQDAGGRGSNVLGTEIAILQSLDLAKRTAENLDSTLFPPEENSTEEGLKARLTGLVKSGIYARQAGRYSNIIDLNFLNEDRQIVTHVLQKVIDTYLAMHVEIHRGRGGAFDEYLTQQTDQLRAKLNQTERELQNLLSNAEVINIETAKAAFAAELARMQQLIRDTELELAINQQRLEELKLAQSQLTGEPPEAASDINLSSVESSDNANLPAIIEDYENTLTVIEILESRERELLLKFTPENGLVKGVREQLSASEAKLEEIETKHPNLFVGDEAIVATGTTGPGDLISPQAALVRANEYRLAALKEQLGKIKANAKNIETIELQVNELERRRELEEANYKNFLTSLEQSRIDEALSAGKINNITVIQNPTPASMALSDKLTFAGATAGGIAVIGLAWAFLVELFLDRSIKRPVDIKRHLGIPLFLSLPDTNNKTFRKLANLASPAGKQIFGKLNSRRKHSPGYTPKSSTLIAASKSNPKLYGNDSIESENDDILPWQDGHPLQNHFDALRDRVTGYFESKNLQHKPKLVGFTGLGKDPGVSTIASGVASSLSKTEGGNVLLIDMTLGKESAQQFYRGEEVSDLEDALQNNSGAKRLGENLYVVAEGTNGYKLPKLLPNRLNSIIPRLKASDFDYIVFDMPAVSAISPTTRLASFMDVMLMVIESEGTDIDVAHQAVELLSDSKTHLGAVLNKANPGNSKQIEQEFVGLS